MKEACKQCDVNQVRKVCSILSMDGEAERLLKARVEEYLDSADMDKTNPEVMGEVWEIIAEAIGDRNPYKEIKEAYNQRLLELLPDIEALLFASGDRLGTALKLAISGNLIDFAAKHEFDIGVLKSTLRDVTSNRLAVDDSAELFDRLRHVRTLLYLGDNCGEIVLDKLFIQEIRRLYPQIKVFYGVRGAPIVNDVTLDDASMVRMEEAAAVIANGDGALGTVMKHTSPEFQAVFAQADLVIAKGQGNYESLTEIESEQMYFLFMGKCEIVTEPLGIPLMSIVCMKARKAAEAVAGMD